MAAPEMKSINSLNIICNKTCVDQLCLEHQPKECS
jgi:hypothetical protein